MNTLSPQHASFDRLSGVIRRQRWLMVANALVTFVAVIGAVGAVATFVL
jgi:uncharacterized protein involved in exopolysaccharide biosynthesis